LTETIAKVVAATKLPADVTLAVDVAVAIAVIDVDPVSLL